MRAQEAPVGAQGAALAAAVAVNLSQVAAEAQALP
jgi:hypothetical protein